MSIEGFAEEIRAFGGIARTVYYRRNAGPGVVVLHEIPGLAPEVVRLGRNIADVGYTVAMPVFFGVPGKAFSATYQGEEVLKLCVNREFNIFANRGSSPVVDWIRQFCIALHEETASPRGVGVVGLCVTGSFALAATVGSDGVVQAPVMSEPSIPFPLPGTPYASGMNLTLEDQSAIAQHDIPVIGLRFTGDALCRRERFDAFEELLGKNRFKQIEVKSPDSTFNIPADAHSVLTFAFQDSPGHPTRKALDDVIAFLATRLR